MVDDGDLMRLRVLAHVASKEADQKSTTCLEVASSAEMETDPSSCILGLPQPMQKQTTRDLQIQDIPERKELEETFSGTPPPLSTLRKDVSAMTRSQS